MRPHRRVDKAPGSSLHNFPSLLLAYVSGEMPSRRPNEKAGVDSRVTKSLSIFKCSPGDGCAVLRRKGSCAALLDLPIVVVGCRFNPEHQTKRNALMAG